MKILFCTNKFEEVTNGPAKFANLLLQINDRFPEHQLKILTEDVIKNKKNIYKLRLRYPPFLRLLSQFIRIWSYYKEAKKIKETDFDFDVIVFNNAFIGLLCTLKFPYTIGMINDYNNASRNWKNIKLEQRPIKQFIFKQLEHLSVCSFNKIIVNSDYLKDFISNVYSAKKRTYYKLYKCIEDVETVRKRHFPTTNDEIHILFVKSDFIHGGLSDLIEALDHLNYSFKLTIIGPPKYFSPQIQAFQKNNSNVRLNLLGAQSQSAVYKYMETADIFCVPSRKEALGVANLEAIARGLPVVSTDVGGIPEILNHSKNGWMVPPKEPTLLAEAIYECINNKDQRETKTKAGINFSKRFSVDVSLNRFLSIVKSTKV